MSEATDPASLYLDLVEAAAPAAAKALRSAGVLSRGGAAEALAAAVALLPLALARHQRRRGAEPAAARDVLAKYGPESALAEPGRTVGQRFALPDLSARLGGLLGDDGPRAAAWIATRSGDAPVAVARALAAAAPVALAALGRAAALHGFDAWLLSLPEGPLAQPASLIGAGGLPAAWFSALRSKAFPWWTRVLP